MEGGVPINKCVGGNKISSTDNRCAYFNCKDAPNQNECNETPVANGQFRSQSVCNSTCPMPQFGLSCDNATSSLSGLLSCNTNICSGLFSCRNNDGGSTNSNCGFCCCDPSKTGTDPNASDYDFCRNLNSKLQCLPNKTPCSGSNRGLCCGCSANSECNSGGSLSTNGCGNDSCCRTRPQVVAASTTPSQNQNYVCRNALITAPFDTKMNIISFAGNFVLLEEHDSDDLCPAGTNLLALGNDDFRNQSLLAKAWKTVQSWFIDSTRYIAGLFGQNTWAQAPQSTKIYCEVPGSVVPEQLGNQTILKFAPNRLLSPDTVYFAIVKGQDNLASSSTGVLSNYNIGMAGGGYDNQNIFGPFTDVQYPNSYIWSFRTLSDNNATSGICEVSRVSVDPAAHIFQKNTNDLNENDIDAANSTFDTISDRDRVYTAKAWSTTNQLLRPVQGYSWNWAFAIDHPNFIGTSTVSNLPNDETLLTVQPNITDQQTALHATAQFNSGNYVSTADKTASTTIRIFVCANPWPAVTNDDYWLPESDSLNCNPGSGNCNNYHYEFYYCRDAGDPNTTADDLPAISSGADAVSLGQSTRMVCSNNRTQECSTDPASSLYGVCGGGFCIWDILKESYFFKQ